MQNDVCIITVVYCKNEAHKNLAEYSYESFPGLYRIAVTNNNDGGLDVDKYNDEVIVNDKNNLSKAWNKGIKRAIELHYKYVLLSNLDVILHHGCVKSLYSKIAKSHGLISATYTTSFNATMATVDDELPHLVPVKHGDGSFSCYLLDVEAYKKVGEFDENFNPAYFEDNDYLERIWIAGYKPERLQTATYYHFVQGTVKNNEEDAKAYPVYMQNNLEYFKEKWGKVPDHLPQDIRFI